MNLTLLSSCVENYSTNYHEISYGYACNINHTLISHHPSTRLTYNVTMKIRKEDKLQWNDPKVKTSDWKPLVLWIKWSTFLTDYNFEIVFRPGGQHWKVDALSSRADRALRPGDAAYAQQSRCLQLWWNPTIASFCHLYVAGWFITPTDRRCVHQWDSR